MRNDGVSSLVVVFFLRGTDSGFPGPSYDGVPWIQVTGSYPNGTSFLLNFIGDEAIVSSSGPGANGIWGGESHNISFTGTPDSYVYQVELNTEAISGMFNIKSVGSVAGAGRDSVDRRGGRLKHNTDRLHLLTILAAKCCQTARWRFSRASAGPTRSPTGDVTVEVQVNGTPLTFSGMGYHDKVCQDEDCCLPACPSPDPRALSLVALY